MKMFVRLCLCGRAASEADKLQAPAAVGAVAACFPLEDEMRVMREVAELKLKLDWLALASELFGGAGGGLKNVCRCAGHRCRQLNGNKLRVYETYIVYML